MSRSAQRLRSDALLIWRAGLERVRSERLIRDTIRLDGSHLVIDGEPLDLTSIRRIVVVGAGKAGAGMAAALEETLGPELLDAKQVTGWVNVPADCVRSLSRIHLHAARPPGINEPTEEGDRGAREILRLVESAEGDDLCLCLLSGGASALMPVPAEGITLADKLAVTRELSAAGANINQLNTVRKQLSRIKGGGLWRACRAGRLYSLIISDVLGDPLDVIGSGPTVADSSTPAAALAVLEQFADRTHGIPESVLRYLRARETQRTAVSPAFRPVRNVVIGNNALAVEAAAEAARCLGYSPISQSASRSEGEAEEVGRRLVQAARQMQQRGTGPDCLISGGEPVVTLAPADRRGKGGRNQQLVLAALVELLDSGAAGIAILSGGTDGEDGPTDAAGALVDEDLVALARKNNLDPPDYLARNDAWHFFEPLGGLLRTGPTHTNVCDVRIVLVDRNYH